MTVTFSAWTQGRSVPAMGTNNGARALAFQEWRHFKEAFTPELVARAIDENPTAVRRCLDPFGGSGTTAMACQFLGVEPITIEVNPYLSDLIEAKLTSYDSDALVSEKLSIWLPGFTTLLTTSRSQKMFRLFSSAPTLT